MLHLAVALMATFGLGIVCAGVVLSAGIPLWLLLARRKPHTAEVFGPCFLLGLAPVTLLGILLVYAGGLRGLTPGVVVALFTLTGMLASARLGFRMGSVRTLLGALRADARAHWVGWLAVAALAGLELFSCAAPNTGWDAYTYHYALIEQMRTVPSLPSGGFSVYEHWHLNAEVLNALWMATGGERMANVFSLVQVMSLGATVFWAVRRLADPFAAWCGAFVVMGLPVVVHQSAGGWADTLLIQSCLAAYVAFETGLAGKLGGGWGLMAGAFAGYAWGVKQSAPLMLLPLGLVVVATALTRQEHRRYCLLVAAGVLILAGPWVARTWVTTGNPLFPAFPKLTRLPHPPDLNVGNQRIPFIQRPVVLILRHVANYRILNDGIPLWVPLLGAAGVVGALFTRVRSPQQLRQWMYGAALVTLTYLLFPAEARYAVFVWVMVTLASVATLRGHLRWLSAGFALLSLGLAVGIAGGKARNRIDVLTGRVSNREFVLSRYPDLRLLDAVLGITRPGESAMVINGLRYRSPLPVYDADPRWPGDKVAGWGQSSLPEILANCRELKVRWILFSYWNYPGSFRAWAADALGNRDASPEEKMGKILETFPEWRGRPFPPDTPGTRVFSLARRRSMEHWVALRAHLRPVRTLERTTLYELLPAPNR